MTALPPAPNVIAMTHQYTLEADVPAINKFYLKYSGGPPSAADLNTLSASMQTPYNTNLIPLLSSAYQINETELQDIGSATGATGLHVQGTSGARGGSVTPVNCCVLLNHLISRRYRGGKPRHYLPFLVDADLANNQHWSGTAVTSVTNGWAAYLTAITGLTAGTTTITGLVNVSYYQGFTNVPYGSPTKYRRVPTLRSGGPVIDAITSSAAGPRVASQRKRLTR